MRVGVPKEVKPQEYRVGLAPESVRELTTRGIQVIVESGAGAGIDASDDVYQRAGARIASTAAQVFRDAGLIVKVKEPQPVETALLEGRHILFTYLHLAADPRQTEALLKSRCTAIAYETVTDGHGGLPLLAPMSEVAGRLSIFAAQESLRRTAGGSGKLLSGVPGVRPARVVIIGGGVVGTQAARMALGVAADVVVLDRSMPRLRSLDDQFGGKLRTRYSTVHAIEEEVAAADAVIGAVLIPGAKAPKLVSRALVAQMGRGSVVVDVAIDQGGTFETSRPTTHEAPTFIAEGVVHYCVANMPGAVPKTSTYALNNATLPFVLALATQGEGALRADPHLLTGLNVRNGKIANAAVAESLGADHVSPAAALG